MKFNRLLLFAATALTSLFMMSGCLKDNTSVSFEGTWDIDTSSFLIVYDEEVSKTNPEAIIYLRDNKTKIIQNIMKPEQIIFTGTVVDFIYKAYEPDLVYTGTFSTYEIYATIYNHAFTSGIIAACNSRKLELYYTREYMMSILSSILTKKDPDYTIFDDLIDSFDGVGVYYKNAE